MSEIPSSSHSNYLAPVQTTTISYSTFRSTTEISTPHTTVASTVTQPVKINQQTSTSSPILIPNGQNENLIMKNIENSIRGKILFLDIKLQRKLLDFLMSLSGTELTKHQINDFLNSKQDFNFLVQINSVLNMLNTKLQNSQQFINQIDDLAELYFLSTLNNYY